MINAQSRGLSKSGCLPKPFRIVAVALVISAILAGCSSSSEADETPSATSIAGVDLRISPSRAEVVSSARYTLTIEVEPNGNEVAGVQARLMFDPERLRIASVSADSRSPLDLPLGVTEAGDEEEDGELTIAAGRLSPPFPTSAFALGSVTFDVLPVEMPSTTMVSFITEGRLRTIASINGEDITGSVAGSTLTIQPSEP